MIYLVIQGKIKAGAEEIYTKYLQDVAPLMKEYGVEVELVGTGFECGFTNQIHQNNAVLRVKDRETLEKFLGDERYLEIKKKYRDKAYEYLNLSVFENRPPRRFD
ncbi:MAG: DUF1330 domain-containing protein [Pyrinomonadaceae bacterium]|nr:DUF1330 domain-containing protein [Pyrinomonadaceae bacterium]